MQEKATAEKVRSYCQVVTEQAPVHGPAFSVGQDASPRGTKMSTKSGKARLPKLEDRLVCAECVGDDYLKAVIDLGTQGQCSYGHKVAGTMSLVDLAEYVRQAFKNRYVKVSDDPKPRTSSESYGESSVILNLEGISVEQIIRREVGTDRKLAADLQRVMEKIFHDPQTRNRQQVRNPFGKAARYEPQEIEINFGGDLWDRLQRYVDREDDANIVELLDSVFRGMPKIFENNIVIVEKDPENRPYKIFRARFFRPGRKFYEALTKLDQELGAPPPECIEIGGRLNAAGTSMFYGAEKKEVAIAEIRPPVGSVVLVACFNVIDQIRLLDVSGLEKVFQLKSVFDSAYKPLSDQERFLYTLSDRLSTPVMPGDEIHEYKITQKISEYLSNLDILKIDGLIYLSTQTGKDKKNVALFNKSARVKDRCVTNKKDVTVRFLQEISDPRIDHEICEYILSNGNATVDDRDERISKLELDVSHLSLYSITGTRFSKTSNNIVVTQKPLKANSSNRQTRNRPRSRRRASPTTAPSHR